MSAKPKETIVLMRFEGVSSRTDAEKLVGQCLVLYAHQLPTLSDDEYYVDTLKGLAVMSQDSQIQLGVVNDMLSATAGEYLEIIPMSGRFEDAVVVPFHEPFIHKVLMAEKQVWLAGLDSMFNGEFDKNVAGTEA